MVFAAPGLLVFLLAQVQSPPGRGDPALRAYLLSEYPKALSDLQTLYSNGRVSVKFTFSKRELKNGKTPPFDEDRLGAVERSGESRLLKTGKQRVLELKFDKRDKAAAHETVIGLGKRYSFGIDARPSLREGDRVLKWISPIAESGGTTDPEPNPTMNVYLEAIFNAPFSLAGLRTSALLEEPGAITSGSRLTVSDRECIKVDFHSKSSSRFETLGWFALCPRDKWIVVKFDYGVKTKAGKVNEHAMGGLNDYTVSEAGWPVLRRVQRSLFQERRDFVLDNLQLGRVSDDEFTLSAYGLPELGAPSRRNRASYWYLACGIAAILLAFAIRYAASRSRKTATPSV
jgi:hypothetical protein